MKKTLVLGAMLATAMAFSGPASAEYDLATACTAAVADNEAYTDTERTEGCACILAGTNDEITASFESQDGAEEPAWSEAAAALVGTCFPAPPEAAAE